MAPTDMPDDASTHGDAELERLLGTQSFPPPAAFVANALLADPDIYRRADEDPEGWWEEQARSLEWFEPWNQVLDWSNPPFARWFVGGKLNACHNCVDRHVANGLGDRVAFHWRGEEGEERDITYADLHRDVQRLANALHDRGIGKGDVVGIYLPMIPEVVISMLACARIGAPHNVVFGGFAAEAVRERMEVSGAKALITADGARRKGSVAAVKAAVDAVIDGMPSVETVVVVRHTGSDVTMQGGRDVWMDEVMAAAAPECPAEPLDAEHPLFVLYTSGSTAKPKGILHTTGGYLTGVSCTHRYVFDLKPETDVYWCAADVGWVTGHSYIVYGPLANAATSIMYEGAPDYPAQDVWWGIIERYRATILYTAPTAIRACMKWGADKPAGHDLSSLRLLGSVGEPINPRAWLWYWLEIGGGRCPVVDTWWQTETGNIMITPLPGITAPKPGSAMRPFPGVAADVVDADGRSVGEGTGILVLTRPWPGMLRTLYGDDERFREVYWTRFGERTYLVGDAARRDADGDLWILGRIDDVINVSAHRMSTAEVESALVSHRRVAEAAVVGQSDELTGQAIVAFVTLVGGGEGDDALAAELREHVATKIGKIARPRRIVWADDLPKTRSGKIMRRLLRDLAEGRELGDVTTLRDPVVMAEIGRKVAEGDDDEG